jgi:hypothetical protein
MNVVSALFGDSASTICVGSLVFLLLYVTGFVVLQRWNGISGRMPVFHRHLIPGLGAALAATAVGFWFHSTDVTKASAEGQAPTTISPLQVHDSIKAKSLPVQRFEDHTLVFPGPE